MSNIVKWPAVQSWPQQSCPQPWPPSCSCGCNPCQCGGGWNGLMQCWQDISQFQQFLQCMLSQIGPFPMQGVTDGSNALPGNIGEFVTGTATMSYAAYPAVTTTNVAALVVPPGDWDIQSYGLASTVVGGISYDLAPLPAGMSNDLRAWIGAIAAVVTENPALAISTPARGSFTVPTLLAFAFTVNQSTDNVLTAGSANLVVNARRMR